MPKFFGLETSFQTVFYTNRTSCHYDKIFRKRTNKKTAGNERVHYPAEFFVNQIYPKVLLVVFWTKFANCNGSLPHLALAKCLQLLLQALTIVRL